MTKTWKKVAALCCAAAMTLGLTACGGGDGGSGEAKTEDVGVVLTNAQKKLEGIKSMQADMVMDMNFSASEAGQTVDMKIKMDMVMQMFSDPMKVKADMNMTMDMGALAGNAGPQEQAMQMYIMEENGVCKSYTNAAGAWASEEMDAEELTQYDPQASMDMYLKSADSFKKVGEEDVKGMKATKYSGVIKSDAIDEVMAAAGMDKQMETLGLSGDQFANLYKDMGDLPIDLWINEDGYPVRYDMDMTDMMSKLFAKIMEQSGAEAADMKIEMRVSMLCYNFDKVEDFTLPAEAAAA